MKTKIAKKWYEKHLKVDEMYGDDTDNSEMWSSNKKQIDKKVKQLRQQVDKLNKHTGKKKDGIVPNGDIALQYKVLSALNSAINVLV